MSTRSSRRAKRPSQNPAANTPAQAPSAPNAPTSNAVAPNAAASDVAASDVAASDVVAPEAAAPKTPKETSAKAGTSRRAPDDSPSSQSRKTAPVSTTQRGFAPAPSRQAPSRQRVAPRPVAVTEAAPAEEQSLWWWKIAALCIVLFAAGLRLWHLDLVPFHHDEGVNGDFLVKLFKQGTYAYNPTNFHGPTLYYFALVSAYFNTFLFGQPGLNDFSMRLVPALFGIGVVALTLGLRRHIGAWASLLAACLLAISPGMVYISRYFIHEMHFVFFTLATVVYMLRFRETGRAIWPVLASVSFALVFASKETAPISLVVLVVAWLLTGLLCDRRLPHLRPPSSTRSVGQERRVPTVAIVGVSLLAFALVIVVFFTSFGRNYPQGLKDFLAAYAVWKKTGDSEFQAKPFLTYVVWMLTIEPPILILGALGTLVALWQRRNRFIVFCALWACGLMFIYSKINYKTPWLMLNFALPLAIVSGWVLQEFGAWLSAQLSSTRSPSQRAQTTAWTTLLLALPIVVLSLVQMRFLNFLEYDNDEVLKYEPTSRYVVFNKDNKFPFIHISRRFGNGQLIQLPEINTKIMGKPVKSQAIDVKKYPYVYVHTQREYFDLLHQIDEYAAISGLGKKMPIMVASPEYWPMPWYLRDYPVGYYGQITQPTNEGVVIGRDDQDIQLQELIGGRYTRTGEYPLRPGVTLTLWVRRDLAIG